MPPWTWLESGRPAGLNRRVKQLGDKRDVDKLSGQVIEEVDNSSDDK